MSFDKIFKSNDIISNGHTEYKFIRYDKTICKVTCIYYKECPGFTVTNKHNTYRQGCGWSGKKSIYTFITATNTLAKEKFKPFNLRDR